MIEDRIVIGNAWGKPRGMDGPEHYWIYTPGSPEWKPACGSVPVLISSDDFGGVYKVTLTHETNPLQIEQCAECLDVIGKDDSKFDYL